VNAKQSAGAIGRLDIYLLGERAIVGAWVLDPRSDTDEYQAITGPAWPR